MTLAKTLSVIYEGKKTPLRGCEVRHLTSEAEVRQLYTLDTAAYGETGLSFPVFLEWWKCYPKGIWAFFEKGQVIGALGFWPITRLLYGKLSSGRIYERDIRGSDFRLTRDSGLDCNWYISGLVFGTTFGYSQAKLVALLYSTLVSWMASLPQNDLICASAIAYSSAGEALLNRFGFRLMREAPDMPDGYPFYVTSP